MTAEAVDWRAFEVVVREESMAGWLKGGPGGDLPDLFGISFQLSSEIPLPFPSSLAQAK